jgi:hypothetical protein
MIGKIRSLVLALTAVAVLGATMAAGAQAGSLDIGASPAVLTGHSVDGQSHLFSLTNTNGGKFNIKCTGSLEGTTQGQFQVPEVTLTATYSQCQTGGGMATTVRLNGCKYTLTGAGQAAFTFLVDIVGCTAGKKIEIITPGIACTLTVGEQFNIPHVVFDNAGGNPQDVQTTFTLNGIHVVQDGAGCPDGNNHTSFNLTLNGNTTTKAFVDVGTAFVFKHNHQYFEHLHGGQVGLLAT